MKGRFHSYINSAEKIILQYKGEIPLALFLKNYFKKDTKFGSRDRKTISSLCYAYYRVGIAFSNIELKDILLYSYFLCSHTSNELLLDQGSEWNDIADKTVDEKIDFLLSKNILISLDKIFPCSDHLGNSITQEQNGFIQSHLFQPDLFLRIRPGKKNSIQDLLKKEKVNYIISGDVLRLKNGTDISSLLNIDQDVVVQDWSSQQIAMFISKAFGILNAQSKKPRIWDCCAASGGKSIMAFDLSSDIEIAVSDIRSSILKNLKTRFAKAGIKKYNSFEQDLKMPLPDLSDFNMIIADVPCSGSGTWGRTPEEMYFFNEKKLLDFALRQKAIMGNLIKSLYPGTILLYITCSVYKDENEAITEFVLENSKLKLIDQQYFKGYSQNADSMFAALYILES